MKKNNLKNNSVAMDIVLTKQDRFKINLLCLSVVYYHLLKDLKPKDDKEEFFKDIIRFYLIICAGSFLENLKSYGNIEELQ